MPGPALIRLNADPIIRFAVGTNVSALIRGGRRLFTGLNPTSSEALALTGHSSNFGLVIGHWRLPLVHSCK